MAMTGNRETIDLPRYQLPRWVKIDKILTHVASAIFIFCLGWGVCSANYRVDSVPQARTAARTLAKVEAAVVPALKRKIRRCEDGTE